MTPQRKYSISCIVKDVYIDLFCGVAFLCCDCRES